MCKLHNVGRAIGVLVLDHKYKWVKVYKINWRNPLSLVVVPLFDWIEKLSE